MIIRNLLLISSILGLILSFSSCGVTSAEDASLGEIISQESSSSNVDVPISSADDSTIDQSSSSIDTTPVSSSSKTSENKPSSSSSAEKPSSSSAEESSSSSQTDPTVDPSSSSAAANPYGRNCNYHAVQNTLECVEDIYKTTTIGTQIWMGENLNYEADSGSYCYDDQPSNCDKYGRLYTWTAAMNGEDSSSSLPSNVQGICPNGWHLPSQEEWEILASFVAHDAGKTAKSGDNWTQIGPLLKNTTGWYLGRNGTNDYGFTGKPAGVWKPADGYLNEHRSGVWWSTTAATSSTAHTRFLTHDDSELRTKDFGFTSARSIRCLMD